MNLSDRTLNPLMWPFLFCTFVYGIGAAVSPVPAGSSLVAALIQLHPAAHYIWGFTALGIVIGILLSIMYRNPTAGKWLSIAGFMLWVFGAWCYIFVSGWVPLFAVATPNIVFWLWLNVTLAKRY